MGTAGASLYLVETQCCGYSNPGDRPWEESASQNASQAPAHPDVGSNDFSKWYGDAFGRPPATNRPSGLSASSILPAPRRKHLDIVEGIATLQPPG